MEKSLTDTSTTLPSPNPPLPSARTLTSQSALLAHLATLTQRESELTLSLNELLSDRGGVDEALEKLRGLGPRVREFVVEVEGAGKEGESGAIESGAGCDRNGNASRSGGYGYANSSNGARTPNNMNLSRSGSTSVFSPYDEDEPNRNYYTDDDPLAYQRDPSSSSLGLIDRITKVYTTSERVGGKVRTLDREVRRVGESLEWVGLVLDVKEGFQTLIDALGGGPLSLYSSTSSDPSPFAELDNDRYKSNNSHQDRQPDYLLASTSYSSLLNLHRSHPTLFASPFAIRTIPNPENPSPPLDALKAARDRLLRMFKEGFEEARRSKDESGMGRFFGLFARIDEEEEGIQIYGDFVVDLVRSRSAAGGKPSSPMYYISHLTSLLESIALIINQHQSIVEKYYGPLRMITVLRRLQTEADRVVKSLVEGWEEERRVGRLIADTEQSKFSYLNNPIAATQQQSGLGVGVGAIGTTGLAALSQAQHNLAALPSAATSLLANYAGTATQRQRQQQVEEQQQAHAAMQQQELLGMQGGGGAAEGMEEDKGPDVRDVERVLGEMSALGGRWALYRRFVWSRLEIDDDDDEEQGSPPEEAKVEIGKELAKASPQESVLQVLDGSESQRTVDNMLRTYYEPLENWYLRTSIEKAHEMDTPDLSSAPYLSSVVDDVFYLLKLSLNRIVSTGSIRSLSTMQENISTVIERDYMGILQKKMDAVYSGGGAVLNLPSLPGQNKEAERERREKDMRTTFSVLLNDLDVSAGYMERLIEDLLSSNTLTQHYPYTEIAQTTASLQSFTNLSIRMRAVVKSGLDQLFNQLTRPKLRALLEDCYKGITYVLDEEGYGDAEAMDLVRKRFAKGWEPLVEGYKQSFTEGNYQLFFGMTVEVLVRPWEKMVFGMRFTELGAIRFDRDVRAIANYLSTQSEFGGAREKFIRLQQIATLLNLDADEDPEDFCGSSGIPWKLSKTEYNNVAGLRT